MTLPSKADAQGIAEIIDDVISDEISIDEICRKHKITYEDYCAIIILARPAFKKQAEAERWKQNFMYVVKKVKEYERRFLEQEREMSDAPRKRTETEGITSDNRF